VHLSMKTQRLLIIGGEEPAAPAIDEVGAAMGLLIRRMRERESIGTAVAEFEPDTVLLDPAALDSGTSHALRAVADSGAQVLLLNGPGEHGVSKARQQAAAEGLAVAGMLAKPVSADGLETALRALAGELAFSSADISAAIMRGEITAWYQLQLARSAQGWRAHGAEALARWEHPQHGAILPDAFVPLAEAEGQIAAITDCVLLSSVQQLGAWRRAGLSFRVSVNLSPALVTDPDFPERLARLVHEYDVPPKSLVLEIPEPSLAQAPESFLGMLARLRILGFGLALEHFGSGNSSLTDLYRTPFSELKIDRRLISHVDDEDARRLVRGIILLAHELGLETTAEAVETEDALAFLHAAGCDRVQGYVVSRPLPAVEFRAVAARWR
jgi:EAL domain-containing protein (putative c-di-GMP-specific phosphodiesterase class I)